MDRTTEFQEYIAQGYACKGDYITLGTAILDGQPLEKNFIKLPLKVLNRHGLIAGATGTGKTKTLQGIAEKMSEKGISVLLMDIKGDLSGMARPGTTNAKIEERQAKIGLPFKPQGYPVEIMSISAEKGVHMRATVSEFGPVLFSRILDLNATQAGVVAVIFKYSDDKKLPLLDLKDFKKLLNYAINEGEAEISENYGKISTATAGTILRKVVELEQQGAETFFGEPSFEVDDLCRIDQNGKGYINIIRLTDLQDRPKLFATFMLSLLGEIYASFPEEGDMEQPKLCIFIDEAHLIFDEASPALLDQIENIVRLIRSKAVGVYFCTQNPTDVPEAILGQLGLKVQHALRAFTAKDRQNIKLTAQNYPDSSYYKTDELLTSLGIGEAAITVLDEKGRPTPLAATLLCAPSSRMGILDESELDDLICSSALYEKYNQQVDRQSAYEILTAKLQQAEAAAPKDTGTKKTTKAAPKEEGWLETVSKNPMAKQIGNTFIKEVTRGLLGVLGLGGKKKSGGLW